MLNFWDDSWPLMTDVCPCDAHFVDYLREAAIRDATIFHFGTGEHHVLGIDAAESGAGNAVWGITASKREYETYIDLVIARPDVARVYNAVFSDIYLLNRRLLPRFDVATLFHLHEFHSDANARYGGMNDRQMTDLVLDQMEWNGRLLFYTGSAAFDRARGTIDDLARAGRLTKDCDFKTLEVYRKLA